MAGKSGGSWKVAYADFVTAMMAFFLVMWITAQNNAVKQAIAHYFDNPYGNSTRQPGSSPFHPAKKETAPLTVPTSPKASRGPARGATHKGPSGNEDPKTDTKSGPVLRRSGFALHDGHRSGIGTVVLFQNGSDKLDAAAEHSLSEVIPAFVGKLNKIEIRGHAARRSQQAGSANDPWQLSYSRCLAAMNYLEEHGIEPKRFRLSQSGLHEPRAGDDDPNWQISDSRVEVYMLAEFVDDVTGTKSQTEEHDTPFEDKDDLNPLSSLDRVPETRP